MGKVFKKPVMCVELFVANQAVSTCTIEKGVEWTFDCMAGNQTDKATVVADDVPNISGSCTNKVGYASGITTARDYQGKSNHTTYNSTISTWSAGYDRNGSYFQVVYSGTEGILYADATGSGYMSPELWTVDSQNKCVTHNTNNGLMHHMVAPVISTSSINASW